MIKALRNPEDEVM